MLAPPLFRQRGPATRVRIQPVPADNFAATCSSCPRPRCRPRCSGGGRRARKGSSRCPPRCSCRGSARPRP
eukprot:3663976-Alexandrium_andersonii.AAC.1